MKVYILFLVSMAENIIEGVFASRELAEKEQTRLEAEEDGKSRHLGCEIQEYNIKYYEFKSEAYYGEML